MSRLVDHPIILSDGGELVTLRDAGEYIQALPARRQETPEWQTATRILDRDRRGPGLHDACADRDAAGLGKV